MPRTDPAPSFASRIEPAWRLFYRFLWPFQYFRDVTRGTTLERQQNYRHNRGLRRLLPAFAIKWLVITAIWFGCGTLCDQGAGWTIAATGCYVTASLALIVAIKVALAWIWLERFPELL
ncbi:MAG: hypothetical protein WBP72_08000 [Rhodocyclaceae bacterium]